MSLSGLIVSVSKRLGPVGSQRDGDEAGTNADETASQLQTVVEAPLGFPPLARALVPDDVVTIPLLGSIGITKPVAIQLVQYLLQQGVHEDRITILLEHDAAASQPSLESDLASAGMGTVQVAIHDPTDAQSIGYLAAAEDASPIVFARRLLDADLVIPIFHASRLLQAGEAELFPSFSDQATRSRLTEQLRDGSLRQLEQLAAEARMHLGVLFEILVVAHPNGEVHEIVAGMRDEARQRAEQLLKSTRGDEIDRPADIVVASPRGEHQPYNWRDFLTTVQHLAPLVTVEGTLVIVGPFQLDASAPEELVDLADWRSEWDEATETSNEASDSSHAGETSEQRYDLSEALDMMRIVVHGPGCEESVDLFEANGVGVADSLLAVQRLIDQADQCLIVNDALQTRLRVKPTEEGTD